MLPEREGAMISRFEKLMLDEHKGKDKAITSRDIEAILDCKGTDVRRMVNELRSRGIPICSSQHGYFYAVSKEEVRQTVAHLNSRMKSMRTAKAGIMQLMKSKL